MFHTMNCTATKTLPTHDDDEPEAAAAAAEAAEEGEIEKEEEEAERGGDAGRDRVSCVSSSSPWSLPATPPVSSGARECPRRRRVAVGVRSLARRMSPAASRSRRIASYFCCQLRESRVERWSASSSWAMWEAAAVASIACGRWG